MEETVVEKEKKKKSEKEKTIKCVVWDLDNTLWDGILLEDKDVKLNTKAVEIIKTLDKRGVLHSIASRNNHEPAIAKLEEFGLLEYFLYPQINWNSKASSIEIIAKSINIGLDTLAFIDDQPFELEEVKYSLSKVLCINTADLDTILYLPEMNPRFITDDSQNRRLMYLSDIKRNQAEETFVGPKEEFLATLDMSFVIATAQEEDLKRAEELTLRTNQLNTTGYTYSYDELNHFRQSPNHKLLIASLDDKFGSYGKIGLALVECQEEHWTVKLLLMSCRVMNRGVGTVFINYIRNKAKENKKRLLAEFVPNDRNRMMHIAYKFAGFKEVEQRADLIIFEDTQSFIQSNSDYMKVTILD